VFYDVGRFLPRQLRDPCQFLNQICFRPNRRTGPPFDTGSMALMLTAARRPVNPLSVGNRASRSIRLPIELKRPAISLTSASTCVASGQGHETGQRQSQARSLAPLLPLGSCDRQTAHQRGRRTEARAGAAGHAPQRICCRRKVRHCCVPPANPAGRWRAAITPSYSSCCRPACESARRRRCASKIWRSGNGTAKCASAARAIRRDTCR